MNAANLCPSPRFVSEQVAEWTRDIDGDCSFNNRAKFADLLEQSRQRVARHLRVEPDEVALVRNTSEANNIVNSGFPLKSGDEVLLWDQNHPTNNVAWEVRSARSGFRVKRVSTPAQPRTLEDLIRPFERALTPQTRVLALTHASNISGIRLPISELSELAHRRNIYVHVDGAQSWGALDVNLRELGCDSYTASAHKWLTGPREVGLLYVKAGHIPRLWPAIVAPGWGDDVEPDVAGARKFESFGQRDDARLAAMSSIIDFHLSVGTDRIESRVLDLTRELKEGAREIGASLVTPMNSNLSAGVCILQVPEEKRQSLLDALYDQHGIAGSTAGGLRLCPHIYNTREHIGRALEGIRALRSQIA